MMYAREGLIAMTFKIKQSHKSAFEKVCVDNNEVTSVVLRRLMRDYAAGTIQYPNPPAITSEGE